MSTNDLFIDNEDIARAVESIANPREALVGEGKKFKTDDDLARGKLHSDLFIEKQNIELAQERARRAQIEAELEALRNRGKEALEAVDRNVTNQTSNTNENAPKMFTQEDLQKIVKETLQSDREVEARRRNVDMVKQELQKTWGVDYTKKLEEAAKEFGGTEEIGRMAETNPKALLKLVGVKESTPETPQPKPSLFSTPPVSTVRPSLSNTNTEKGASYFAKQRKELGDRYFSGEAFAERLEAITRLGDNYFKH